MPYADLQRALDELVHAAADLKDTGRAVAVLAAAVVDLESATGSGLGPADADPLVLLQRRLGRLHRLLLAAPGRVAPARLRTHLAALGCAPATEPAPGCPEAPRSPAVQVAAATV